MGRFRAFGLRETGHLRHSCRQHVRLYIDGHESDEQYGVYMSTTQQWHAADAVKRRGRCQTFEPTVVCRWHMTAVLTFYWGRLLVVSHTDRGEASRIISVRVVTRRERKIYEEG